jgi:hypothetical protein
MDRKYHNFENLDEKKDIQYLLEVEYRDGRIFDVRDVSDKPQNYFDFENSISGVRENISGFKSFLK